MQQSAVCSAWVHNGLPADPWHWTFVWSCTICAFIRQVYIYVLSINNVFIHYLIYIYISSRCTKLNWKRSFPFTTFTIIAYNHLLQFVPRSSGVWIFYLSTFAINLTFVYVLLNILHKYCRHVVVRVENERRSSEGPRFEGTTEEDMAAIRPLLPATQ